MTVRARVGLAMASVGLAMAAASLAEQRTHAIATGAVADHDDSYEYRLPYGDSVSYPVLQTYGSKFSHRGAEHFTIDFAMPAGTPVYAARAGVVLDSEDEFTASCLAADCDELANFIEILHPDGTTGKYYHLQTGSVLVAAGARVRRGQVIARSGDTGFSSAPHLHFGVYLPLANGTAQSIAVRFSVRGGMIGEPRAGARYLNRPD
jgi:murein DD-endopeptidase MepM/ murein hydrolase activator NlpD